MSSEIYGDPVVAYVAAQGGHGPERYGECTAIGFLRDGEIEGGVIYHGWENDRVELTCAATDKRWFTRPRARLIFGYPFTFCSLAWARSDNPTIQRAFRLFGGEVFPTPVMTICTLRKEQAHGLSLRS